MTKRVDYQTGGYPQPEYDWDMIRYKGALSIPADAVLRIVEAWCIDLQNKFNYGIKTKENNREINRTDIELFETSGFFDEAHGRYINPVYKYKRLGKIFIHPNPAGAYVFLLLFNWKDYGKEAAESMEIPVIPNGEEMFDDLIRQLNAYTLSSAPVAESVESKQAESVEIIDDLAESLRENELIKEAEQADGLPLIIEQAESGEMWQPWLHIPNEKEHRQIIEFWCRGKNAKEIAKDTFMKETTIHNIISGLRKSYPEARIPKDRERKSMRF